MLDASNYGHPGTLHGKPFANGGCLRLARDAFRSVRAYFAAGALETGSGGRHPMVAQLGQWTTSLGNADLAAPRLKTEVLAGENHDTVFPAALTRGLLHFFAPVGSQP